MNLKFYIYNTGCWQLMIFTFGFGVTLITLLLWYLLDAFGKNSKQYEYNYL